MGLKVGDEAGYTGANIWSRGKDNHGQISLDFLVGFGIFALAFLFVFSYITGLFVPFVTNSDELTMAADRTAEVLVGDFLAVNDTIGIRPGILNTTNISSFIYSVNNDYDTIRANLALNRSGNALYSLEVIITFSNGTVIDIVNNNDKVISKTGNMGQSKRFVFVRDPTRPSDYPGSMAVMRVRIW